MTTKTIAPSEFLKGLDKEMIQRAYHVSDDASFSREGDRQAAAVLTKHAQLQGFDCVVSGETLRRHRSAIGLVAFRSPRGSLRKGSDAVAEPEAQPSLELQPVLESTSNKELLAVLRSIDGHLKDISKALWAGVMRRGTKEEKPTDAPTEPSEPSRPVLVAAGGGQ